MEKSVYPPSKQRPNSFPYLVQQYKPPIVGRKITERENMLRVIKGEMPVWMPAWMLEADYCWSDEILEHPKYELDGYDWFGTEWVWVDIAGGMMVKPGTRTISNILNWKKELVFPDLNNVNWEKDAAEQTSRYDPNRLHAFQLTEGIFERLHAIVPFEEALEAMIVERECILEFFERMADYKIEILDKVFTYYEPIDYVVYYDSWGTQRAGFFPNEMYRDMLFPSVKRVVEFAKSKGKFVELHSTGLNQQYIKDFIDMGFDIWAPQAINDSNMLKSKYGDKMCFSFPITGLDNPMISEEKTRHLVRNFVDEFGGGGRVMAQILSTNPKVTEIALDELYNYSLEYYRKN